MAGILRLRVRTSFFCLTIRKAGWLALAALLAAGAPAMASTSPETAQFARAERMRQRLERQPDEQRSRAAYERVLDAYRAIYHGNPAAPKADAAIVAVAELLAEEGRTFHDEKRLQDAIGQYEFLCAQYPASPWREGALLKEGEIWQHDLGEPGRARAIYREFLRKYPRSDLAGEARADLRMVRSEQPERAASRTVVRERRQNIVARAAVAPWPAEPARSVARPDPAVLRWGESGRVAPDPGLGRSAAGPAAVRETTVAGGAMAAEIRRAETRNPAEITEIRHWSTPDYTRVAIYLQQQVPYTAARVADPDRVYFDLYGTRLAPRLRGHTAEVTDEGFLSQIQVAQLAHQVTRVVLNVGSLSEYSAFFLTNPARLIIDIRGRRGAAREVARLAPPQQQMRAAQSAEQNRTVRREQPRSVQSGAFWDAGGSEAQEVAGLSSKPDDVPATRQPTTAPVAAMVPGTKPAAGAGTEAIRAARRRTVPPAATPPAGAQAANRVPRSMVRALGLKINRIVIDAGHGGHDSGTIGPGGLEEKNVVLDVALRLGRLLRDRLGADVIYTRKTDTFIPLEQRTAIANQAQADLFISIHANSSPDPDTRGIEVYYLNFTTSADALEVAARENAVSQESIHELSSLVKKIALDDKIDESRMFAADVDASLYDGLESGNPGLRDRGVKKAPFVVLIGANMPSILAEISFLSNPTTAQDLRTSAYRERIAEALYRGVARYVGSVNGLRVAQDGSGLGRRR